MRSRTVPCAIAFLTRISTGMRGEQAQQMTELLRLDVETRGGRPDAARRLVAPCSLLSHLRGPGTVRALRCQPRVGHPVSEGTGRRLARKARRPLNAVCVSQCHLI